MRRHRSAFAYYQGYSPTSAWPMEPPERVSPFCECYEFSRKNCSFHRYLNEIETAASAMVNEGGRP